MGVPKLKAKAERNYRKGLTWKDCSGCDHFVRDYEVMGCGKGTPVIRTEGRCRLIGLKPGRQYRILPHYLCDDFDDTKAYRRRHRRQRSGPVQMTLW